MKQWLNSRLQKHAIEGIAHGHFQIKPDKDGGIAPEGLWIHLLKDASEDQVEALMGLQKSIEAGLNDKSQRFLEKIFEETLKEDA